MKKTLIEFAKYGLGFSVLAWVFAAHWDSVHNGQQVGLSAAFERPDSIAYWSLVLAFLIGTASVMATFVRWYILVRAQDLPFTMPNAFRLGLVGFFFNTFLPGSVGGDIIKAACIAREQQKRSIAVSTVLLDRAIGLCGLFWLVAVLGAIFWMTGTLSQLAPEAGVVLETIVFGAWIVVAASLTFWFVLGTVSPERSERAATRLEKVPKVGRAIAGFWRAVRLYRLRGGSIGLAMLLSMVGHVGFVLFFYFAASTLTPASEIPSLGTHFVIVPVGMTIQAGFPAPGGVGGAEFGYGMLYKLVGAPAAYGVLGSLVQRFVTWVLGAIGLVVYLRMRPSLPATHPIRHESPQLAVARAG